MLKTWSWDRIWKIALSLFCYYLTYLISSFAQESIVFIAGWKIYFVPLLVTSAIMSVMLNLMKLKTVHLLLIISLKLIIVLIIGYPLGRYVAIEQTLLFVYVLEAELYLPGIWGIVSAAAGIFLLLCNQGDVQAWGLQISGATKHDFFVMLVHSFLFFILVSITKISIVRARSQGEKAKNYNEIIQEIAQANLGFQDHAEELEQQSKEEERKRLTRELHDSMGYTLTSQKMMIEAAILLQDKDPEKLRRLLFKAKEQISEGHEDVRKTLRLLRKVEPVSTSYLNRITHSTKNFSQATGVTVYLETSNLSQFLDPAIGLLLHRLIQEGMTNAFCHGKATIIRIHLYDGGDCLFVTIADNGKGSESIQEGIGLRGMNERIAPIGGKLICQNLHPGFKLQAVIPKKGETCDADPSG